MRLIDADALKRKIYMQYDYSLGLYDGVTFIDTVEEESTVDAMPISWIESQVDKGKWAELVQRWAERKAE